MAINKDSVSGTLLVAFLVCLVCAVVVAVAAVTLRPLQNDNRLADKRSNILQAAGLYQPGMDIEAAFANIERRFVDIDTGKFVDMPDSYDQRKASKDPELSERLPNDQDPASIRRQAEVAEVYLALADNGDVNVIILPVHGYGLWSTLYGFIALEPDANTVAGLGFYEHAETPGLGGEVDNPRWKALWPGKKIYNEQGELAIEVIKGSVDSGSDKAEHQVDGLAGASLTTRGVNNLVRFWLGEQGFGPFLDRVKNGALSASMIPDSDMTTSLSAAH